MQELFSLLSAILILIAAPPYIIDTLRSRTKPERVTWFILSVLGIIAFVSQLKLGASWTLVFSGLDTSASILVFVLSIKYGVGGHTKLDIGALIIATLGVIIALVVREPLISLLGVIIADVSGVILTVKKTYLDPDSETTLTWMLVGTASIFGALSAGEISFAILLYPVYLIAANYAVPFTQFVSRRHRDN